MRRWLQELAPYAISMALHVLIGGAIAGAALLVTKVVLAPPPLEVELVVLPSHVEATEEDNEGPEVKKQPDQPQPPPPPRRRRKPRRVKMLTEVPRSSAAVPDPGRMIAPTEPVQAQPVEGPVRPGPAAAPVYGISMDSANAGGGTFGVPVGNTLRTSPTSRGPVTGPAGKPASAGGLDGIPIKTEKEHKITAWPKRTDDAVFLYPEAARAEGIEGSVRLRLWIDAEGKVRKVKLLEPGNPVLDQEALANIGKLRFSPALKGKTPVPCEIVYTFTFVLD